MEGAAITMISKSRLIMVSVDEVNIPSLAGRGSSMGAPSREVGRCKLKSSPSFGSDNDARILLSLERFSSSRGNEVHMECTVLTSKL